MSKEYIGKKQKGKIMTKLIKKALRVPYCNFYLQKIYKYSYINNCPTLTIENSKKIKTKKLVKFMISKVWFTNKICSVSFNKLKKYCIIGVNIND